MARLVNRLSATKVARETKEGMYPDGNGLYLQVGPTGTRSWALRYQVAGKARQMGLGSASTFTLAEARERARQTRQQIADGIDPIDKKARERSMAKAASAKAMTFKQAAEKYIAAKEAGWKSRTHAQQWTQTLEDYAYPVIGKLDVAHVETSHVMQILEPIWTTKVETASRLRGRIESVLSWAKARHLRTGDNPAIWRGHLDHLLAPRSKISKVKHHAAMPVDDMPAFMTKLRSMNSISARALEFTILTAARTGEVIGMTESEIDFATGVWTIPAERMKADKEHTVPLSPRALEIAHEMPRIKGNPYIFPGAKTGRGLSNLAMLELLRGVQKGLTVHGFRSTFRDWAGDRTNFAREVIEHALAHLIKDQAEAAYRRSDALAKRRRLMTAWAGFCGSAPVANGENVTPIRGAA